MNGLRIERKDAVLVAIDFQDKLMPNMFEKEKITDAAARLIKGCRVLGAPIMVTQQYTKGIGATVAEIADALTCKISENIPEASFEHYEKTTFSAMGEPSFVKALADTGRRTVILAGVEAHVCVQQTALSLIEAGYIVYGAVDCMSSRTQLNKEFGQLRMTQSGVIITGYESVLFDMLVDSKDPDFKTISLIVK